MAQLVKFSEATALALHAMALVAQARGPVSAKEIAQHLQASEAHVAKVLHILAQAGLLDAKRGPSGGYILARPKEEITLLQIYEVVEGPLRQDRCVFNESVCKQARCILNGLVAQVRREVAKYLESTTLADLHLKTLR